MDRWEILVHEQTADTCSWTDQGYQSMDKEKIAIHGQRVDTSLRTDRRY